MPMPRSVLSASVAAVALVGAAVLPVAPASAAASVERGADCFFEPGDVPGVDVFFPATCTFVTSDTGSTTIIGRAVLPEGYSLSRTFVGPLPCFGSTGRVTATVSGQVTAVCHV